MRRGLQAAWLAVVALVLHVLLVPMPAYSAGSDLRGEWDVEVPGRATSTFKSAPQLSLEAYRRASPEMHLSFKVACNSYVGKARVEGSRIEFDVEAGALIGCAPELVAQDRDFVRRLEAVTSFEISRVPEVPLTKVQLKSKDGSTLVILRAGR